MTRAADQSLSATGIAHELDPEVVRRGSGPDASEVAAKIVHAKRWMTFIGVEEPERFRRGERGCYGSVTAGTGGVASNAGGRAQYHSRHSRSS